MILKSIIKNITGTYECNLNGRVEENTIYAVNHNHLEVKWMKRSVVFHVLEILVKKTKLVRFFCL